MILLCFGTRPEWLKIKPLIKVLDQYKLLFTGQHPDLLEDIEVDYSITISDSNNRLDQLISDCLLQFPEGNFDSVLVQGDTASAFACAVAAFNRKKKIFYLEAGLRSYDLNHPYPEEGYRQMIARISDINLCPTELSKKNLVDEKISGECHVVGNTVLDNLLPYKDECEYTNKVLVTLHRRENHDLMNQWFDEVNKLAKNNSDLEFILPIHPNPNVQKYKHILTDINVIEPLPHSELLDILVKCKLVISDSGGLQEEGSFFNKKVIVCRKTTERPEAIETGHLHMCLSPNELENKFNELIDEYNINVKCPYGDGKSSIHVADLISPQSDVRYWEKRYASGGKSGGGSYGNNALKKSEYVKNIIKKYNIKTINDYGHGDGNQLMHISGFDHYTGYDISNTARKICIKKFPDKNKYKFIDDPSNFVKSDLVLSLDVLYHITNKSEFEKYLKKLFSIGKYVLIYACDKNNTGGESHCLSREFTPYIESQFPNFKLIDTQNVIHKHVAMYLYKEII
mgnify:CR=1 FL=1